MLLETLQVKTDHTSYSIDIGTDLQASIQTLCSQLTEQKRKGVVLTTQEVQHSWKDFLQTTFSNERVMVLPSGEQIKSFQMLENICEKLVLEKIDRKGFIVIVGGGSIGDLGGFVAACFLRGIDYYQVPTTLMGMVDSSIGGKTGINLKSGKNLVGAFHNPTRVFIDLNFLTTLSAREFNSGMAEVIKYGLLGEEWLYHHLIKAKTLHPGHENLLEVIKRSCLKKIEIIEADEKELTGKRLELNLGHTFAHAIEAVAGYGEYLHGEAVGLGLILMAKLSQNLGYISPSLVEEVSHLVHQYQLPLALRKPLSINDLMEAMYRDKKNIGGNLRLIIMKGIGKISIESGIDEKLIRHLWEEVGAH